MARGKRDEQKQRKRKQARSKIMTKKKRKAWGEMQEKERQTGMKGKA